MFAWLAAVLLPVLPVVPVRPVPNRWKTSALKTSANWRDFNFAALTRFLEEMEETYVAFSRVDVVVDVNEGNSYQERVRQWRSSHSAAARVHVHVTAHLLSHPFRLAWVHREHMASAIEQYDWFMSAEADGRGRRRPWQAILHGVIFGLGNGFNCINLFIIALWVVLR